MAKEKGDEDKLPIPTVTFRDAKNQHDDNDDGCDVEVDDDYDCSDSPADDDDDSGLVANTEGSFNMKSCNSFMALLLDPYNLLPSDSSMTIF